MFAALVTAFGQAWIDFDVYMPDCWAQDPQRRAKARIPGKLAFATKPELAIAQARRLITAGVRVLWAAADEVYGRSGEFRAATAIELLREALPRNRAIGAWPDMALSLLGLARLLRDGDRAELAEALWREPDPAAVDARLNPRLLAIHPAQPGTRHGYHAASAAAPAGRSPAPSGAWPPARTPRFRQHCGNVAAMAPS